MTAPAERADAARNRIRILDAARRLLAAGGAPALSPDAVAKEAGVGVGTVYRRFRDRAGLVYALIEENETRFQEAFAGYAGGAGASASDAAPASAAGSALDEPPALDADGARDRLRFFLHGMADLLDENRALLLHAEAGHPSGRYHSAPFRRHHGQVAALVAAIDPAADADYLADLLLVAFTPGLFDFQRTARGWEVARIKRGLDGLVAALGTGPAESA